MSDNLTRLDDLPSTAAAVYLFVVLMRVLEKRDPGVCQDWIREKLQTYDSLRSQVESPAAQTACLALDFAHELLKKDG